MLDGVLANSGYMDRLRLPNLGVEQRTSHHMTACAAVWCGCGHARAQLCQRAGDLIVTSWSESSAVATPQELAGERTRKVGGVPRRPMPKIIVAVNRRVITHRPRQDILWGIQFCQRAGDLIVTNWSESSAVATPQEAGERTRKVGHGCVEQAWPHPKTGLFTGSLFSSF